MVTMRYARAASARASVGASTGFGGDPMTRPGDIGTRSGVETFCRHQSSRSARDTCGYSVRRATAGRVCAAARAGM